MGRKSLLYLASVLVILFVFSLYAYFVEEGKNLPLSDKISIQSILSAHISKREMEEIKKDPGKKLIAGFKININTAGKDELSFLPGISLQTANNIVKYRKTIGKFRNYNELLHVKGIKQKRLDKLRAFIEL